MAGGSHGGSGYKGFVNEKKEYEYEPEQDGSRTYKYQTAAA